MKMPAPAAIAALAGLAAGGIYGRKPRSRLRGSRKRVTWATRRNAMRYRPRGRRMSRRRWQARARSRVAHPKNFSTSKTTESVLPNQVSHSQQRLIVSPGLINIQPGTGINQRLRDTVFIAGVKVDAEFKNESTDRVFVNWAIVHPKQDQELSQTQTDFFRDYTDSRTWDAGTSSKTGLTWSRAQINTDEYIILKRGKFMLIPNSDSETGGEISKTVSYNSKDNQKSISHYCRVGRNFTFQDTPTTAPNDQLFFVHWVADPSKAAGNNVIGTFRMRIRAIVYFREPKTA